MSKVSNRAHGSQGHNFSLTASAEIPRSAFDRSSTLKTTFNGSDLNPIFCEEILPADTIKLKQRSFIRLQTPFVPVLDEIIIETQYFFVPLRLIWDLYPRFMGEQPDADDSIDFTVPQMTTLGGPLTWNTLSAKLGIPIQATNLTHSSLFHRAYARCYNDWYRDPNLQDRIIQDTDAGPDTQGDYLIQKRGKRKDMFTGCLPWPQRGDPITLLFDGIVPVTSAGDGKPSWFVNAESKNLTGDLGLTAAIWSSSPAADSDATWDDPKLEADLSTATANTINGLRGAFAVQRLLERDARGGARLTEILHAHFKVNSPDQRLQRAEYIGGSSMVVQMQQVAVTTQNTNANVGDVGGVGIAQGQSSAIMYSATEHGIIMGICSARAPLAYQQGLNKKFSRNDRYDFFWPAFSHIGEQPILNKEIYAQGTDDLVADAAVFGYNEAWSQYRYRPNEVTGKFNSEVTGPLDIWHLALKFSALPTLDASFIVDDTPFQRIVAVTSEPEFLADFAFDLIHTRPIPTFSTPGLIDHF